jgi:hypothetical protein
MMSSLRSYRSSNFCPFEVAKSRVSVVLLQCRTGFSDGEIGRFGHVGMPYQRHVGLCWVVARVTVCLVIGLDHVTGGLDMPRVVEIGLSQFPSQ